MSPRVSGWCEPGHGAGSLVPTAYGVTLTAYANTTEQRRDAARCVVQHARDLTDARLLLDILGLRTEPTT